MVVKVLLVVRDIVEALVIKDSKAAKVILVVLDLLAVPVMDIQEVLDSVVVKVIPAVKV